MTGYTIWPYDCVDAMHHLIDERSVHCCVTSPPYFGLRDYKHAGQIGLEETPVDYVARIVQVARAVHRVLRDDGTFWLNLGDSYANDRKGPNGADKSTLAGGGDYQVLSSPHSLPQLKYRDWGLKRKDLIGIPWRVAFALQDDGWYLRQEIIWSKPNAMPEPVSDRCTRSHEYVFMLTKSPRYYYDAEAIKEQAVSVRGSGNGFKRAAQLSRDGRGGDEKWQPSALRNRRSVWTISTKPFRGAHFATFPPDLIEPCILAGCPEGGTVLDPFGGSGTTALVALRLKRQAILCELNPEYVEMAHARIAGGK